MTKRGRERARKRVQNVYRWDQRGNGARSTLRVGLIHIKVLIRTKDAIINLFCSYQLIEDLCLASRPTVHFSELHASWLCKQQLRADKKFQQFNWIFRAFGDRFFNTRPDSYKMACSYRSHYVGKKLRMTTVDEKKNVCVVCFQNGVN